MVSIHRSWRSHEGEAMRDTTHLQLLMQQLDWWSCYLELLEGGDGAGEQMGMAGRVYKEVWRLISCSN